MHTVADSTAKTSKWTTWMEEGSINKQSRTTNAPNPKQHPSRGSAMEKATIQTPPPPPVTQIAKLSPQPAGNGGDAVYGKWRNSLDATNNVSVNSALSLSATCNSLIPNTASSDSAVDSLLSKTVSHQHLNPPGYPQPQQSQQQNGNGDDNLSTSTEPARCQPAMHGTIRTLAAFRSQAKSAEDIAADFRAKYSAANVSVAAASESVNGTTSPSPSPSTSTVNDAATHCSSKSVSEASPAKLSGAPAHPGPAVSTRARGACNTKVMFSPASAAPPSAHSPAPRARATTTVVTSASAASPTRRVTVMAVNGAAGSASPAKAHKANEEEQQQVALVVTRAAAPAALVKRRASPPALPFMAYVASRHVLHDFTYRWRNRYEENKACYREGGYLQVVPGKLVHRRYVMIQKLGWGEFSTVWLAYDTKHATLGRGSAQAFVAVKIAKCHAAVRESSTYEMGLLRYINARLRRSSPVTNLIDSFEATGEYGTHLCMVMPVHGSNLLAVIDQLKARRAARTPEERLLIKECLLSTLTGLHELHAVNVIHTDLKPENVLCNSPDSRVLSTMETFCVRNSHRSNVITLEELRAHMFGTPGAVAISSDDDHTDAASGRLYSRYSSGKASSRGPSGPQHLVCLTDFGLSAVLEPPSLSPETEAALVEASAATTTHSSSSSSRISSAAVPSVTPCASVDMRELLSQLVTSKKEFAVSRAGVVHNRAGVLLQTREYRAPEVLLGLDITTETDMWSLGCMAFEMITGEYLLDPKKRFMDQQRSNAIERKIDVEHMAMIEQLIGPMPESITSLRTNFNAFYEEHAQNPNVSPNKYAPAGCPVRRPPAYIHRYVGAQGEFLYAEYYAAHGYARRDLAAELTPYLGRAEAAQAASFIMQCLCCYDPRERPTAGELLSHPWLAGVGVDSRFLSEQ